MKKCCFGFISKKSFSTRAVRPQICIVGAGPAGFYAAQHLAKKIDAVIDIYERFPVPFGLVRFGVAPDHPEVKNVISTFTKTAQHPNVNFYGNVNLGTDISLKQLKECYNAVLLTYGAEKSQKLNIKGEHLDNVLSARRIVGWYNGIPWDANLKIDLSAPSVAIFGQGNVAIDVARILLKPVDLLKNTDITQHALEQLSKSKVKEVHLIGRRGPLQAAFTIAELREMLKLPNCTTHWCTEDFEGIEEVIPTLARPKKRITELMLKSALDSNKPKREKSFRPRFFLSPVELTGSNYVEQVKLCVNKLEGDIFNAKAVATDKMQRVNCDLAVTSIGYKSISVDKDIPFDSKRGIVRNDKGMVEENFYVGGWLATGPTGVILTTMNSAFLVAETLYKNISTQDISAKPGHEGIREILLKDNIQIVDWNAWLKIDKYEIEEGKKLGKPREKILDVKKMLEVAL